MVSSAKQPKILGRKAPQFYLGDAVISRLGKRTEYGVVTAIAYDVPPESAPIGENGEPVELDEWFYRVYVYECDEPGYWERRKRYEELGFDFDRWLPEIELELDRGKKIHFKRR